MRRIPLRARDGSVRAYALVDDEDYTRLSRYRWSLSAGYAVRGGSTDGRKFGVKMHREILWLRPGDPEIDHANRNGLDNRKANLRLSDRQSQMDNAGWRTGGSRHRGVARHRDKWIAQTQIRGVRYYLGVFADEDLAGLVVHNFRKEMGCPQTK